MKLPKIATRLERSKQTYEFFVRYPFGLSSINGYRRAARHFGLHTLEDPCTVGTDGFRLLIHKSAQKLREAASVLRKANSADDDSLVDDAEMWLLCETDVHWFHHDWKDWDLEQDEGALENLGWEQTIVESAKRWRVKLKMRDL